MSSVDRENQRRSSEDRGSEYQLMVGDRVIGVDGVRDRAGMRDALCKRTGGVVGIEVQRPLRDEVDEPSELPASPSAVGSVPGAS
eukprot:8743416-Alexandrium_andersonii.AAC.1